MSLDRLGSELEGTLPNAKKGLLLHPNGAWSHYSSQGNTVKLRALGSLELKPEEKFDVSDTASERDLLEKIRGSRFYSGWPMENAHGGRDQLVGRRSPIPQTRIRILYETLRTFSGRPVSEALLKNALDHRASNLITIFETSFDHFRQYRNVEEDFGDRGKNRKVGQSSQFAKGLARDLEYRRDSPGESAEGWHGAPDLGFDFVGREVDFCRTSGGVFFDDGSSGESSGAGGLDLWLRAHDGKLPIVGEVKAETDTNAFLALIQALAYTCELVTPAQLERVEKYYPTYFPEGHLTKREGPFADIYLICEGEPKLLKGTHRLAKILLPEDSKGLRQHIRKIVCLLAPKGGGVDDLSPQFVVE